MDPALIGEKVISWRRIAMSKPSFFIDEIRRALPYKIHAVLNGCLAYLKVEHGPRSCYRRPCIQLMQGRNGVEVGRTVRQHEVPEISS